MHVSLTLDFDLLKWERRHINNTFTNGKGVQPFISYNTISYAITCIGGLCCSCFIARHILMTIDIRQAGKKYVHLPDENSAVNVDEQFYKIYDFKVEKDCKPGIEQPY